MNIETFVQDLKACLEEKCMGGQAVTRAAVAEMLKLPKERAVLIGELLHAGFLPEYCSRKGQDGGIVLKEFAEQKPAKAMDTAFAENVLKTLTLHVPARGGVSRAFVAKEMYQAGLLTDLPSSETENRIGACIAKGLCPGFASQRGKGIYRCSAPTPTEPLSADGADASAADVADAVEVVSEVTAEVAEAAPQAEANVEEVAETSKKKSKKTKK